MSAVWYLLAWTGTAPELDTEVKPTLHIGIQEVTTPMDVVCGIGEDAEEPVTSM